MSEKLAILRKQLEELDAAPLMGKAAAARCALRTVVEVLAGQSNTINVLRSRLDNAEARASDALGRAIALEGKENGT